MYVNRVNIFRKRLHITQKDLAKYCGVTQQCISGIERYKSMPSLPVAISISKKLCIPVEEIFTF